MAATAGLTRRAGWVRLSSPATGAALVALTIVSFVQRPGRITFDTKLDLVLAPGAFLGRAVHLWNPEATFGELQNQAYGYLFPVGPFFVLAEALHVPAWVAQRLWCALLLCVAFLGALFLARALKIGKEPARYVAALGYALAPRVLTEIGPVSVEMLPAVMLPWVLLPLVRVDRLGSPRRAAMLSGLAVLGMGGVNASMVLMALTLPGVWLLTRRWTRDHVKLVAWWCAAVLAATVWWLVPLFQLAGYSLPFLDYIESAANTTAPLSLFQVLRGTNQWVAYIVQGEPWWPAGFMLVDNPVLMVATTLVAGIGLVGLAGLGTHRLPERTFLVLGALAGLLLLTMGHVGPLDSPFAQQWQRLLDGPLAAFRNVHKFDPVLRLTLAMGFAHAVSRPWPQSSSRSGSLSGSQPSSLSGSQSRSRSGSQSGSQPSSLSGSQPRAAAARRWTRGWQPAVAGVLVLVMAAPAWLLVLRPGKDWAEVPDYWHEAARWLGERDATSRTLMVPASGFGEYRWGRTVDEPLQALAQSPWAVRSQVPLGSEGNTRFMDSVSDVLASGRGSPALADHLARAGVHFLLLRNDLDTTASLGTPPAAVLRQSLRRSTGIALVRTFGPAGPLGPGSTLSLVDRGVDYAALEVYEVQRPMRLATVAPVDDVVTVSGGPESVLPLLEQGVLRADQPTILAGDAAATDTGRWVVTDGLRRRERNVGRVHGNLSQTLAGTDPIRHERPVLDLLPFPGEEHLTVAQYQGVRAVVASSSVAYADAIGASDPSNLPFAAVDGDPVSLWRSSSFTGPVGEWLEVTLDTPRVFDTVSIDFPQDLRVGWPVARIRITTDRGSVEHDVPEAPGQHPYSVPAGASAKVKVTVLAMRGGRLNGNVAIRELSIPGVVASRPLRVPSDVTDLSDAPAGQPPVFAFSRGAQPRSACVGTADGAIGGMDDGRGGTADGSGNGAGSGELRCDPDLARVGEEPLGIDRRVLLRTPGLYGAAALALPRLGSPPWTSVKGLTVQASSQLSGDPAVAARMAFDGDPSTSWLADVADSDPTLTLRWTGARTLDALTVEPSTLDAANPPLTVQVRAGAEVRNATLREGQTRVDFDPVTADTVQVTLRSAGQVPFGGDGRSRAGGGVSQGVSPGVSELRFPALDDLLPAVREPFAGAGCGFGPQIEVDGTRYDTQVFGNPSAVRGFQALQVLPCGKLADEGLPLGPGQHRIRALPTPDFVVQDLTLRPVVPPAGDEATVPVRRPVQVVDWGPAQRRVQVGDGPRSYLVVPENANAGWVATAGGHALERTRIDGWQQAWVLPAGVQGVVELSFRPDRVARAGLGAGAVAVLLLVVGALLPPARLRRRPLQPSTPSGSWWAAAVLATAMFLALGGPAALIVLLGCLLARHFVARCLPAVVAVAVLAATAVSVTGRLTGHGQDWAVGLWPQLALLIAVGAVIAALLYPSAAIRREAPPLPR